MMHFELAEDSSKVIFANFRQNLCYKNCLRSIIYVILDDRSLFFTNEVLSRAFKKESKR